MSAISQHVGQRIKKCRKSRGFTIEQFSKIINKSKATLSKYENGKITIDIETLLDIADALEIEFVNLIDYRSPNIKPELCLQTPILINIPITFITLTEEQKKSPEH
ncbi:MAG TPA: helix-turn-helix transcriptional regulator [Anaerovoracaceae bacterium]|nr:helix-turn-helix transcriptional regulator [Anaerovoracaceae bacterium]